VYKEANLESRYRLDLPVEGRAIVACKAIDQIGPVVEAIAFPYLKLSASASVYSSISTFPCQKTAFGDIFGEKTKNHHRVHRGSQRNGDALAKATHAR
jgi:hypothetical protein